MVQNPIEQLKALPKKHDFFIGIDSDGCVFDTMELKQKECFIPNIVKFWGLQSVSKYVRESAEFVNLYSVHRGQNRFPCVLWTMDYTRTRAEVVKRGTRIPQLNSLRQWIKEETKLGNSTLAAKVKATGDPDLKLTLEWSEAVNVAVEEMVKGVAPFPGVREFLERAGEKADMIVVSQTPGEALGREWREHYIDGHVELIAGQEYGTKTEHLKYASGGKYAPERILMIGDAPGDRKAAMSNNALFFPINPGAEDESWARLLEEGMKRFFTGCFAGAYQKKLIEEFEAMLPDKPMWEMQNAE